MGAKGKRRRRDAGKKKREWTNTSRVSCPPGYIPEEFRLLFLFSFNFLLSFASSSTRSWLTCVCNICNVGTHAWTWSAFYSYWYTFLFFLLGHIGRRILYLCKKKTKPECRFFFFFHSPLSRVPRLLYTPIGKFIILAVGVIMINTNFTDMTP